jgi:hypothetical protein
MKSSNKRGAFSLIIVLIISLIGLAIVGVTMQFAMSAGGSGRMANAANTKYNLLQHGIEEGRAKLREIMDNADPIPRRPNADSDPPADIESLSDLLINRPLLAGHPDGVVKSDVISHSALGRLGILDDAGGGGTLSVMIYDMQYDPLYTDGMSPAEKKRLPPAINLDPSIWRKDGDTILADEDDETVSVLNTGVYLIRATLSVGGRDTILDSAVLQANNM